MWLTKIKLIHFTRHFACVACMSTQKMPKLSTTIDTIFNVVKYNNTYVFYTTFSYVAYMATQKMPKLSTPIGTVFNVVKRSMNDVICKTATFVA